MHKLSNIVQSQSLTNRKWILLQLNLSKRDLNNEIINNSKILLFEIKNQKYLIKEFKIVRRDDYPLKPISIAFDDKNKIVYILNLAFFNQRSIEVYKLKNNLLIFEKRYRSEDFNDIISIAFYNDKLLALNYINKILTLTSKSFIILENHKFQYLNSNLKNAEKIIPINNKIFIIIPKKKKIVIFDDNFQIIQNKNFDFYPYDILFYQNKYIVLLNKKYINILNNSYYSNYYDNESYIYVINENTFNQYNDFLITSNIFDKYYIDSKPYIDLLYIPLENKSLIFNQFMTYSKNCNVNMDFSK